MSSYWNYSQFVFKQCSPQVLCSAVYVALQYIAAMSMGLQQLSSCAAGVTIVRNYNVYNLKRVNYTWHIPEKVDPTRVNILVEYI